MTGVGLGLLSVLAFGFSAWLGPTDFSPRNLHSVSQSGSVPAALPGPPFQPHEPAGSMFSVVV